MATFVGVEFDGNSDGSSIALVSKSWLTPRKREVFWPPYKSQSQYDKALKSNELPQEDTWQLYSVRKCHFECDDYDKAASKLAKLEYTSDISSSDIQSDAEHANKNKRIRTRTFYSSDEESDAPLNNLKRPPKIHINNLQKAVVDQPLLQQTHCASLNHSLLLSPSPRVQHALPPTPVNSGEIPSASSDVTVTPTNKENRSIYSMLLQLTEQNKQILALLRKQGKHSPAVAHELPENIPVQFPINTAEQLAVFEDYLNNKEDTENLCLFLSTIGGRDIINLTNNIMKYLMTNHFAQGFSFFGSRLGKQAFNNHNVL